MQRSIRRKRAARSSFTQILVLALLSSLVYVTAPFSLNSVDSAQAAEAQSFCFDGSQAPYVTIDPVGTGAFTVEFWAKPSALAENSRIIGLGNNGVLYFQTGKYRWYTGSGNYELTASPTLDQWVHIAIVRDNPATTMRFYVNGQLDLNVANGANHNYLGGKFGIGNWISGGNFTGCMAGVSYSTSANYTGASFTPKYPGELTATANTVVLLNAAGDEVINSGTGGPLTGKENLTYAPASTLVDGVYSCPGGGSFTLTGTTITAASNCAGDVILPNGVTLIANDAFSGASGLTSIVLPPSLKRIDQRSFLGTSSLTTINFPLGMTSINIRAFEGSGLTSITLPSTATSLGRGIFSYTPSLVSATFPEEAKSLPEQLFLGATNLKTVTFSSTLTSIGSSAFQNTSIETLTIPATVTTLGQRAFMGTSSLSSVVFEPSSALKIIQADAFNGTTALTSVEIPASVTSVNKAAFRSSGLQTLTFEAGSVLLRIQDFAFYGPNNLETVSLPDSVDELGQEIFGAAADLESVFFEGESAPIKVSATAFKRTPQNTINGIVLPTATGFDAPGSLWNLLTIGWDVDVTFDAQGGSSVATQTSVPVVNSPVSTKNGYTLEGWFDDSVAGNEITFPFTPSADVTVYARWKEKSTAVTYSAGSNGIGTDQTDEKLPGVALALPSTATANNYFSRTGYVVSGWNTNADGSSGTSYALGASFTGNTDITLYPEWTAATFRVIYEYNGATAGSTSASATYTTGNAAITLPTPTREGYTFNSWHTNPALDSYSIVGVAGASYTPTTNLTVYAKWTAISRTVAYSTADSTGGAAPTDATSYIIDQTVIVKSNSGPLVRSGYSFDGWLLVGGDGTVYNAGESVVVAEANIVFVPKWSANTYTYSYNLNGGSGDLTGAPTTWTTGTANITLPGSTPGTFTKTGYTFGGWSTTQGGSAESYDFSNVGNLTLYAVWNIKSISYTFGEGDASGATFSSWPADSNATYGTSLTLPTPVPTTVTTASKTLQFAGWVESSIAYEAGQGFILGETSPAFVAQWVELLDVTYVYSGGSPTDGSGDGDAECVTAGLCTDNQAITLRAAPDRTGYTFAGWRVVDSGSSVEQVIAAGQAATVSNTSYIFNAQWTAIQYSMTFNSLGGSVDPGPENKTIGQLVTMPSPGTRNGYTFTGWTPDSGTTSYAVGSSVTTGTQALSFSAQWVANNYTVTYEWRGGIASGSVKTSDSFTFSASGMTLPTAASSNYTRDGFDFAGWSNTQDGSTSDFPIGANYLAASDAVLFAIWDAGVFTLTYDGKGASSGSGAGTVANGSSITLPTPVRANFTFLGWYDQATGGSLLGAGGASYAPTSTRTLFARWVQDSLYGVDEAQLQDAVTFTVNSNQDGTGAGGLPVNDSASGSTATISIPDLSLPSGTLVKARYFKETDRQAGILDAELGQSNDYLFSLLVSWSLGTGDTATVPTTATGKPITVTLNNSAIKAGASVYQLIGTSVTDLGVAEVDGTIVVELTTDPEIVVLATKPAAPTGVTGIAGDGQWVVSWTAGASGGATITSYTATANPGGASCTTSTTTCTVTGLTNGVGYTFTVTASNSVGTSDASGASAITSFTVTFNANGGSTVTAGSFSIGGAVSAPSDPTQAGFDFSGWSTAQDDDTRAVTFPYSPGVNAAITLYALWTQAAPSPQASASAPFYSGPVIDRALTVQAGTEATFTGNRLASVTAAFVGDVQLLVVAAGSQSLVLGVASSLSPGTYDLVIQSSFGTLTFQNGLTVLASSTQEAETETAAESEFEQVDQKLTVGAFKGFIAIFTKGYEGQKLSAKVAGKWLIVPELDESWNGNDYSRTLRVAGSGYDISVHLYIDGKFMRTHEITTK